MEKISFNDNEESEIKRNDQEKANYLALTSPAFKKTVQSIFERALINPDGEEFKNLSKVIDRIILENKFFHLKRISQTDNPEIKRFLNDELNAYLQTKFSLTSAIANLYSFEEAKIEQNLLRMSKLESELPGSVKKLSETYNIKEFYRYPIEILVSQLKEEEINQPYGITVFSRADHDGSLGQVEEPLKELYVQTRGHFGLKVFEASTKIDLAKIFINLDKKYGSENKISFMLIGGHGNGDFIRLGDSDFKKGDTIETIRKSDFGKKEKVNGKKGDKPDRLSSFFEPSPTIILLSCLAGKENGLKEKISESYCDADVIASKEKSNLKHINVKYNQNSKPSFEVEFYELDKTNE